jgi:phage FluMu gp28-like protein
LKRNSKTKAGDYPKPVATEVAKEKCAEGTTPAKDLNTDSHGLTRTFTDSHGMIKFRAYQQPVFLDRDSGILLLHWSRQIGKSFTLASWAVDRLLTQLQRYDSWLITVLSNSRDNGAEFVIKAQEVCNKLGVAMETDDSSIDLKYENMRMEVRVTIGAKIGRIKVLAANPRTARGFSGDLILDEFAFHEDSNAIWEAAEPILSSNPEFVCRIASTGNGKYNMFYRMASGAGPNDGTPFTSTNGFKVCRVTRTAAWRMGVKVYDPNTRQPITPEEARTKALDKRAYDQNYECQFTDENSALLTHELISAAERSLITIDSQAWTASSLARMMRARGQLECGMDIGRNRDLSVITVIERDGNMRRVIGMLRMGQMRGPDQLRQLGEVVQLPKFRRITIDMTGLGIFLVDEAQERWGAGKIIGINFATTEPISKRLMAEGRKAETARVTEIMATDLLGVFEDRCIEIPADQDLREDLRKPEKIISPGGRVSIAASRDDAGHADHFWSLALAIRSGLSGGPFVYERVEIDGRARGLRQRGVLA